ncbi:tetraspanin-8-like isoform 2-T2 [Aulostomus maculatus]
MGKVNVYVKRSYIIVASLMVIISSLLLAFTLFSHGHVHGEEETDNMLLGLKVTYFISITTLLLPILGLFGVCKEKQWLLIVFTVGMILCTLFLLPHTVLVVALQPQFTEGLKMQYVDVHTLNDANEAELESLRETQMDFQCCGLYEGYMDWGYNISESCLCSEDAIKPCVAAPSNSSLYVDQDHPVMIYKEILSIVLCIVILCQLSKKEESPAVVYSLEAKTGNYTVLTETAELT